MQLLFLPGFLVNRATAVQNKIKYTLNDKSLFILKPMKRLFIDVIVKDAIAYYLANQFYTRGNIIERKKNHPPNFARYPCHVPTIVIEFSLGLKTRLVYATLLRTT